MTQSKFWDLNLIIYLPLISDILGHAKQRAGHLYCCRFLLTKQVMYKCIHDHPILFRVWQCSLYQLGAVNSHLCQLNDLQSCIERTCSFVFQPLALSISKFHHYRISLPFISWRRTWELTNLLPTVV